MSHEDGLLHKYDVSRSSDPTRKHAECRYFVLDPEHDAMARDALRAYAEAAEANGRETLAADLRTWASSCDRSGK